MSFENLSHANKFQITIGDGKNEIVTLVQTVTLPGIVSGTTPIPTNTDVDYLVPGDNLQFDDLILTMLVDEDFKNYLDIYKWMRNNVRTKTETDRQDFRDITVLKLTNNSNPNLRFVLKDAFPYTMPPIPLDVATSPDTPIMIDVTFKFTDMYVEDKDGTRLIDAT